MIVLISVLSFIFDNSLLYIFFQTMFEKKKRDYNPYYILFAFIIADSIFWIISIFTGRKCFILGFCYKDNAYKYYKFMSLFIFYFRNYL